MSGILQASIVKDSASATSNLTLDASGNVAVGNNLTVTGSTTVSATSIGNLTYTGTLTGSTGILNIGSGQIYKDASGNVGIGTATPAASLSITKQTTTLSGTGNAYGVYIYPTSSGLAYVDAVTSTSGTTSLGFRTYNNGTYNDAVRIDSSGNLLVGTTTSGGKIFSYQNTQ